MHNQNMIRMNKKNIEDVTFLIPVRIDSIIRLENLLMVIEFLTTHFKTNIQILEAAEFNNSILPKLLPKEVSITFIEDYDPVFYRTKYINMLVRKSDTPFLGIWDADVIVSPGQIVDSIQYLRENEIEFVYPYKKDFLDTSPILRELYFRTRKLSTLLENVDKMEKLYLPNPVGGGFFAERKAYLNSGMENEFFYGWGREDGDRLNRWNILGYSYKRISGPLFHLTHERGINSKFHTNEQNSIKMSEILRIHSMSKSELEGEIKTWDHNSHEVEI